MSTQGAAHFDRNRLVGVTTGRSAAYEGTFDLSGWCDARTVLILGPGSEVRTKRSELGLFIAQHEPVVTDLGAFSPIART